MVAAMAAADAAAGATSAATGNRGESGKREWPQCVNPLVGPRGRVGPGGLPSDPDTCVLWWNYGFCSFGLDCDYNHAPERGLPIKEFDVLFSELVAMGELHTTGMYQCHLCSQMADDDTAGKVGETTTYKYCRHCGNFYFYPHVQLLIIKLLYQVETDYLQFKRLIDKHAKALPPILHVPWYYEAHRWATSRFAWSLTGPDTATAVLSVLFSEVPDCATLISVGSGTGYTESVFLQASRQMQHELEVHAYDLTPQRDPHQRIAFEVEVAVASSENMRSLGDLSRAVLLLCWPPFGSSSGEQSTMGFDTLNLFSELGGRYLIYIGDVNATGDWRYHELLASQWRPLEGSFELPPLEVWEPKKMGLIYAGNDTVAVYARRAEPVQLRPPPPRAQNGGGGAPAHAGGRRYST